MWRPSFSEGIPINLHYPQLQWLGRTQIIHKIFKEKNIAGCRSFGFPTGHISTIFRGSPAGPITFGGFLMFFFWASLILR